MNDARLPSFECKPSKTMFGLDKNESFCFTIPKSIYEDYIKFYGLGIEKLQTGIELIDRDELFTATLRYANLNRENTRVHAKDTFEPRVVLQIGYGKYDDTISWFSTRFSSIVESLENSNHFKCTIKFEHLGGKQFFLRIINQEDSIKEQNKEVVHEEVVAKSNKHQYTAIIAKMMAARKSKEQKTKTKEKHTKVVDNLEFTSLSILLDEVLKLQSYFSAKNTPEMQERGYIIRNHGPAMINPWLEKYPHLSVEGRDGTGLKTRVPWIRVYCPEKSPSATTGWYIVFLFAFDGSAVYLSLNQGTTDFINGQFIPKTSEILEERVLWARDELPLPYSISSGLQWGEIDLCDRGTLAKAYQKGDVLNFKYKFGHIPSDEILQEHIFKMINLLDRIQ